MRKSSPRANPLHAQILSIRKEIVISLLYPPTRMRLLLDARIATLMEPIPLSLIYQDAAYTAHIYLHQLLPNRPHMVPLVLCCCINESTIAVVVIVASSS